MQSILPNYFLNKRGSVEQKIVVADEYEARVAEFDLKDEQHQFLLNYPDMPNRNRQNCELIGINVNKFYRWRKQPKFKAALKVARDEANSRQRLRDMEHVERAEDQLFENILNGKEVSLLFYLKNRCPERWKNDYELGQVFIQNNKLNMNFIKTEFAELSNKDLLKKIDGMAREIQIAKKEGENDELRNL